MITDPEGSIRTEQFSEKRNARYAKPRKGTSLNEFMARFPDSDACLAHVFSRNHDEFSPCPKCGRRTRWFRIRGLKRYSSNCCGGNSIHPLSRTMFARSSISLHTWFYAILHFCNTSTGISAETLSIQLGISHDAAYRMGKRIRMHLAALDSDWTIGAPGQVVYVYEDRLVNIQSLNGGTRDPLRIVALYDGKVTAVIPIAKGRFAASNKAILRRVHSEALLEFKSAETLRKMSQHRRWLKAEQCQWRVSDPYRDLQLGPITSMLSALKIFILRNHLWVREDQISYYIAHFEFLYRRRKLGKSVFEDAISHFPDID